MYFKVLAVAELLQVGNSGRRERLGRWIMATCSAFSLAPMLMSEHIVVLSSFALSTNQCEHAQAALVGRLPHRALACSS